MKFLAELTYTDIDYSSDKMKEVLEQNKVVVLRDFNKDIPPSVFFDEFSQNIGTIINIDEDVLTGNPTGQRWIDISYDPAVPDRYRTAPVGQPLHTDCSYIDINDNIQFFYCNSQAKYGGATTFMDSRFLVELMEMAGERELMESLMTTTIHFEKTGRERKKTILSKEGNDYRLNWNFFCVSKDIPAEHRQLINKFHEFLETRIVRSGLLIEVTLKKNDVVFFHDELVLHGRNSYFASAKGERSLSKGMILLDSRLAKNTHLSLT